MRISERIMGVVLAEMEELDDTLWNAREAFNRVKEQIKDLEKAIDAENE